MGNEQSKPLFKNEEVEQRFIEWRCGDADSAHQYDRDRFFEFAVAAIDAGEEFDLAEIEKSTSWPYVIDDDTFDCYLLLYEHFSIIYDFLKRTRRLQKH